MEEQTKEEMKQAYLEALKNICNKCKYKTKKSCICTDKALLISLVYASENK